MVKFIIKLLILVIAVLGAGLLVRDDPGMIMLRYRGWEVESNLAVALAMWIVVVVAIYYLVRLLRGRGSAWRGRAVPTLQFVLTI